MPGTVSHCDVVCCNEVCAAMLRYCGVFQRGFFYVRIRSSLASCHDCYGRNAFRQSAAVERRCGANERQVFGAYVPRLPLMVVDPMSRSVALVERDS